MAGSSQSLPSPSSPKFFRLCHLCDKPFTKEYSYNRHISYCRRAQSRPKARQKSCLNCSTAKVKCSFGKPRCSRCAERDTRCMYGSTRIQTDPVDSDTDQTFEPVSSSVVAGEEPGQSVPIDLFGLDEALATNAFAGDLEASMIDLDADPTAIMTNVEESFTDWNDSLMILDGNSQNYISQHVNPTGADSLLDNGPWMPCTSTTKDSPADPRTRLIRPVRLDDPASQRSSNLAMSIMRAFPQMMLRRQTFPPFIHGQWHRDAVPEKLANCMAIAQMFTTRSPDTRGFLWKSIEAEVQSFHDEVKSYSMDEVQSSFQALLIYMIMALMDPDGQISQRGARMVKASEAIYERVLELLNGRHMSVAERTHPSVTWEDWITAESLRRLKCIWFLMSFVIPTQLGRLCIDIDVLRGLPLCSAKTMWEARTREEWETERAIQEGGKLHQHMWNFGALIDAHQQPKTPENASRLEAWEAGTDKIGTLMSIAVDLL